MGGRSLTLGVGAYRTCTNYRPDGRALLDGYAEPDSWALPLTLSRILLFGWNMVPGRADFLVQVLRTPYRLRTLSTPLALGRSLASDSCGAHLTTAIFWTGGVGLRSLVSVCPSAVPLPAIAFHCRRGNSPRHTFFPSHR